ncbi:hypothetical protein T492DRAFT_892455 [Pavlovales sp. CCMP2436]|nr:hypothetical protein T492DRAFT_892455 [Pavlovales sp. CCMP2436]|mmetsp:Transcript_32398/g.80619  ORF Transcript_32398/g.80619 Transcript_32398/m.80619 type:complete len:287 (-) Transcript_32398:84-944(-)
MHALWLCALLGATPPGRPTAPPAKASPLDLAGHRAVLVDGCNVGLRFATSKASAARLLDCGGLKRQGASCIVAPLVKWLEASDARCCCLMDGKADLGRHAESVVRAHARLEVSFTPEAVTADERMLEQLAALGGAEPAALPPCAADDAPDLRAALRLLKRAAAASPWVQVGVECAAPAGGAPDAQPDSAAAPQFARLRNLSKLQLDWARARGHVYTLSTGGKEFTQLSQLLYKIAASPDARSLQLSRLRTSSVLCVTDDARLRSACERQGAIVIAPRVFLGILGAR